MSRMSRIKKIFAELKLNNDDLCADHASSNSLNNTKNTTKEKENVDILRQYSLAPSTPRNCAEKENLYLASRELVINEEPTLGMSNYEEDSHLKITSRQNDFLKKSDSLSDISREAQLPTNRKRNKSVPALFKFQIESTCSRNEAKNVDDSDNVKIAVHKVRSLSLSDLTSDTMNDFTCIRKSHSVPALTSNSTVLPSSPSLLAFYASFQDEDEYCPPNTDLIESSTDSELDTAPTDYGDMNEGRKRRLKADSSAWKKNEAKRRRMQGVEYLGYRKPKDGKIQQDTVRPPRQMGETCKSSFCLKSKLRGCNRFTEEKRKQIHQQFWKNMSWDQRKIYVTGLVTRSKTVNKTKSDGESRREGTLSYFLPFSNNCDEKVQVCRLMFLNTLSLGSFTVQSWVKNAEFGITPNQEIRNASRVRTLRAGEGRKMLTVDQFLDNLPKLPSHYARKDTTKLFIEPMFHSTIELFNAYKVHCTENGEPQVCRYTFEKKFYEKNFSLYTLKKDMCDVCSGYKAGNINEADYQIHIIKKNRARAEKTNDKEKAAAGEFILLTMDLEAVKVCPYLTASALYFKTKLTCHNFSIYNLISKHCTCYWFDETATDLTSSTFVSFLIDYIERHCLPLKKAIVIYSDGCTYQNRNVILSNALLNLSKKHGITITQKFLEPGHTQMECDSVHSSIERKLKNREIHLPSDYVTITKEARKEPYETIQAEYSFFKNYASPDTWIYKSIRPGRRAVVDIRAILYSPDMTIKIKLNYDGEWTDLPQRPKLLDEVNYDQLRFNKIPISSTKFNHLQQLKSVLPSDCHSFYDGLPHSA